MGRKSTRKWGEPSASAAIRTLRVDVSEGIDAGRSIWGEDEALSVGTAQGNDLVLGDETVSRFHLELRRTDAGIEVVDQGSTNGTQVGAARLGRAVVPPETVLGLGRTRIVVRDGAQIDVDLHQDEQLGPLVGRSEVMRRVMAWVTKAGRSDASVLLVGESGTGKELVARAIHDCGARAEQPFVTVDCGALAPTLVASELFGHERGAFTGADRQRAGALEQAHGGTLFLDEIGELPRELQPTLLGALERRSLRRVGGQTEVPVDVRIVAATNRDLRADVNAGDFRLDLYYRLAVLRLALPPLRERTGDVPILIDHFLAERSHGGAAEDLFGEALLAELERHHWPGNVRELRNLVDATLALGAPPPVDPMQPGGPAAGSGPGFDPQLLHQPFKQARKEAIGAFERFYLEHLLEAAGGNVSQAARDAGLDRSYLFSLLRRNGLR
ncbi:MAG TPA: sigma 54-interacting transcriptional regulator [Sandaracinaceae bacterium LLY-WYZ-13_1]|nr:sigma 54-interacting transcriptional regulator [Sandaracinaceae bacterium LLY-WYZ-13_1]